MKRNFRYITKFEEETRAVTPVNLSNNTLSLGQMQKLMKAGLELLKDSYGVDMKGGYSDSQMVAWKKQSPDTAQLIENVLAFQTAIENKIKESYRSSSTRLETREAFNPIYYEYGVFQVKKEQVAFWNEVENETDENGNPITVGWYFNFRRGRTKDSDTAIGGVFKSKSEATNALNKRIEEETKKWENKWGDAESAFEASNPHRSSSARLETREAKERVFTATSSEERGRWEIDVELNGKKVFRYDSDSHNPDEEGYEPTEGGWMKNLTDYQGLADWMSHMGVMDKGETLVVERGRDKGRYYARSSSARLETRSLGGGGYQSLDKYQKDHSGWQYFAVYDYLPSMIDKTLKGWQIVNDEGNVLTMYNKQAGYSLEQLNQLMDREGWKLTKKSDTKYSITTKIPSTTIHDSNRYKTKS